MPVTLFRRVVALMMLAALSAATSACRDRPQGDLRVIVIGEEPRLRDPAAGAMSNADALLAANVAQGLVRFDANGNIVGGLAERWNVSDDGLSYIFRIAAAEWPDGRKISAQQVARALKRQIGRSSNNPLKDSLGAIDDIVAMTDRVIEMRLRSPRPNLLALLAQPELGVYRNGHGSGPFSASPVQGAPGTLRLTSEVLAPDGEVARREELVLSGSNAEQAVAAFAAGEAHLVLGGTFVDLPLARARRLPRNSLRFDPASGLFGLVPVSAEGPFAQPEARQLLSRAIDRPALVAALNVPGLSARATVLEPGLDGISAVPQPEWFAVPLADRRASLLADANRLFADEERPVVRLWLPEGRGADVLLARLAADWGALGLQVERAKSARAADFRLLDAVAPSQSPAWFLRMFRCDAAAVCSTEADELLAAAREAFVPGQRYALLLQAAELIEQAQLFIPLAAPVRWSLVSPRVQGFAGNRYARHTLTDLEQSATAGGS